MMSDDNHALDELCYYALVHSVPSFIHQHAVDAAQSSQEGNQLIRLTFALVGLYLPSSRD